LRRQAGDGDVPRIAYDEAIAKYGSDKPDLRNPIEMQDVTEHFRGSGFKVFAGMIEKDPKARVWAIPAPGGGSRAFCDRMNGGRMKARQPGLGYIFWRNTAPGRQRPKMAPNRQGADRAQATLEIARGCRPDCQEPRARARGEAARQLALGMAMPCSSPPATRTSSTSSRRSPHMIGRELKLDRRGRFEFCWIVDFPMYEWNEEEKKIDFSHNPFSMPQGGLARWRPPRATRTC
jgi:aspartyl-tRNA synthetase